ncbi:MAG: hypothetical protein H8E53_10390 [Planctomycetes bacterium]|nr:hypothetical protein [Planctomycetota bacterium]
MATNMPTKTKFDPIRLDYHAADPREVVVTPKDNDRFVGSVKEIATACHAGIPLIEFTNQLEKTLVPKLAEWLAERGDKVHSAFISVREGRLLFLVIQCGAAYDRELTDALTKIDIEIARDADLDMIRLEVMALPCVPDEDAYSFLDPQFIMVFKRVE